jgi:adenylate cyclase
VADAYQPVRECLRLLDGIARKHGGNVDKYQGDCVLAVFGNPFALEDAARAAVNAAIEMPERAGVRAVLAVAASSPGPPP